MLRLWLYCSYTGSPVGFQLGFVDYDAKGMEKDILTAGSDKVDPLLKRCFFAQGVHGAEGCVPEKNIYILVKKLPIGEVNDRKLNVNLAWETDNTDLFKRLKAYFHDGKDEDIFSSVSNFLILDESETEFGFYFDRSKLWKWKESIINTSPREDGLKGFRIKANIGQSNTLPSKLRLEKIYPDKGYQVKPIEGNWYSLEQRPLSANVKKKIILLIVLAIVLLVLYLKTS